MTTRHLLLVRHTESEKNVVPAFSAAGNTERLTPRGSQDARTVGRAIRRFCEDRMLGGISIHAANSIRAEECASVIAAEVGSTWETRDQLQSISTGSLLGVTEARAAELAPAFAEALMLYRKCLLSAYEITLPIGAEDHISFELRVQRAVSAIANQSATDVEVLCLHRSPLTATLIDYARRYHHYPRDFYGYVELPLGSISWIERVRQVWRIRAVGMTSEDLAGLQQVAHPQV